MKKIVMQVSPEFFAFAEMMADKEGYFGAVDYLNGVLNMAVLTAMDEEEDQEERCEGPARAMSPDEDLPF